MARGERILKKSFPLADTLVFYNLTRKETH